MTRVHSKRNDFRWNQFRTFGIWPLAPFVSRSLKSTLRLGRDSWPDTNLRVCRTLKVDKASCTTFLTGIYLPEYAHMHEWRNNRIADFVQIIRWAIFLQLESIIVPRYGVRKVDYNNEFLYNVRSLTGIIIIIIVQCRSCAFSVCSPRPKPKPDSCKIEWNRWVLRSTTWLRPTLALSGWFRVPQDVITHTTNSKHNLAWFSRHYPVHRRIPLNYHGPFRYG